MDRSVSFDEKAKQDKDLSVAKGGMPVANLHRVQSWSCKSRYFSYLCVRSIISSLHTTLTNSF